MTHLDGISIKIKIKELAHKVYIYNDRQIK
jgi:hypothetical protein